MMGYIARDISSTQFLSGKWGYLLIERSDLNPLLIAEDGEIDGARDMV